MKRTAIFLTLAILFCRGLVPKYHPEIRWREISNKRFIVVFPEGCQSEAAFTLNTAEEIYQKLQSFWQSPVKGKIRILLTDIFDYPDSFATFFPFNQIVVNLFNPPPDSLLGNYRDWLRLSLSHEMSHIFVLNTGSKFTYFMRKIFGSLSIFYPLANFPRWLLEGLAIYGESLLSEGGRLNAPDFDIMLAEIVKGGQFPNYLNLYGDFTRWPAAFSRYLYGSKFFQFVAANYGQQKLRELVKNQSHHPIILYVPGRFRDVFGKKHGALWDEFGESLRNEGMGIVNGNGPPFAAITGDGMVKKFPVFWAGENRIIYGADNYREYPGVAIIDLDTGVTTWLIKKNDINDLYLDARTNTLYFSAVDSFRSYYGYSDLYEYRIIDNTLKRLTRGRRLFYPVKLKGSGKLYCVKRTNNRAHLTVLDLANGKERVISEGFPSIAYLSVSPNRNYIAASLKRENVPWCVALFDREGSLLKLFLLPRAKCYYPRWLSNKELYFIAEYDHNYRLARVDITEGKGVIFDDPRLPAIKYFDLMPGENKAVIVYIDANGYNLAAVDLRELQGSAFFIAGTNRGNRGEPEPNVRVPSPTKYRYLRDLLPKHMTFSYRNAGKEIQPGIYISGVDLLSKHAFDLKSYYGLRSKKLNVDFGYTLDCFYPTLMIGYKDYYGLYESEDDREYSHRTTELKLVGLYPLLLSKKHQSYLYANLHFERIVNRFTGPAQAEKTRFNGFKLAFLYNSSQKYYDSFSYNDGLRFSLSYAQDLKVLGSHSNIQTLTVEYKQFIPIHRPNVLALRLALGQSWGAFRRQFYMGGSQAEAGLQGLELSESNLFELMRGFPAGYFSGDGGYLFNAEFRISLLKIERCFSISPSFERIYFTLFMDMGNLWKQERVFNPVYSFGIELNVDIFLGRKLPFCAGIAFGHHPFHAPAFYFRIGDSF